MRTVCFGSPKGGVGKTTLTACMAYALQRLGMKVVVIDFDPQNALRHHFGINLNDRRGFASSALEVNDWSHLIRESKSGVKLLPYGEATLAQRRQLDIALETDKGFLARRLRHVASEPNSVLLADMPPGYSSALSALSQLNPLFVAVMLADSASTAVLPEVESGEFFGRRALSRTFYVVNQFDMRSTLNREVTRLLRERLGGMLLGVIHRDEAIKEAHARQVSIFQHAYASAPVNDLIEVAKNIQRLLASSAVGINPALVDNASEEYRQVVGAPERPGYYREQPRPIYNEPAQPTYQEPAQATYREPAQPTYREPAQPTYNEPARPTYQEPAQPTYREPTQPTYQETAQPSSQEPAQPAQKEQKKPASFRKFKKWW